MNAQWEEQVCSPACFISKNYVTDFDEIRYSESHTNSFPFNSILVRVTQIRI